MSFEISHQGNKKPIYILNVKDNVEKNEWIKEIKMAKQKLEEQEKKRKGKILYR